MSANTRVSGLRGYIYLSETPGDSAPAIPWFGAKSYSISIQANRPDCTGFDATNGWAQSVKGLNKFTGSVEAFWDSRLTALKKTGPTPPIIFPGQTLRFRLTICEIVVDTVPTVVSFDFDAIVSSAAYNVINGQAVSYSIKFEGNGPIDLDLEHPHEP